MSERPQTLSFQKKGGFHGDRTSGETFMYERLTPGSNCVSKLCRERRMFVGEMSKHEQRMFYKMKSSNSSRLKILLNGGKSSEY